MNNLLIKTKIEKIIKQLDLNLKDKIVLTEAATGVYAVTPVIAAVAGAEVYALAKTSKFGSKKDAFNKVCKLAQEFKNKKIHFINELDSKVLAKVDIITNSGHLRPLNKEKLRQLKSGCVISLMYEKWELRDQDVNMEFCRKRNIPVGAVIETHPDLDIFGYHGDMALKLILDAGLCPYGNKFILISNTRLGPYIARTLSKACLKLGVIDINNNRSLYPVSVDWLDNFPGFNITKEYYDTQAIILVTWPLQKNYLGQNSPISIKEIKNKIQIPMILRFAGDIDSAFLKKEGIQFYPKRVDRGHMGILPSQIGYDPIIKLQAGGLKVGQALIEKNYFYHKERICDVLD